MTADGRIDTFERKGAAISSRHDKECVDRLRSESDAVMVSGRTLLDEDPKLTVKWEALALGDLRPELQLCDRRGDDPPTNGISLR